MDQLSPAPIAAGKMLDRLRDAIVSGQLAPGARLDEAKLAAAFGPPDLTVESGLAVLAARGLVVRAPRRGWRVRKLDETAVRQLYAVRALLEREAVLGLAATAFDLARLVDDLTTINATMARSRDAGDAEAFLDGNDRFHATILAHAPNDPLRLTCALLREMALPLQRARLKAGLAASNAVEEHAAIIEMLEAGELEAAADAMQDHILGNADAAVAASS